MLKVLKCNNKFAVLGNFFYHAKLCILRTSTPPMLLSTHLTPLILATHTLSYLLHWLYVSRVVSERGEHEFPRSVVEVLLPRQPLEGYLVENCRLWEQLPDLVLEPVACLCQTCHATQELVALQVT